MQQALSDRELLATAVSAAECGASHAMRNFHRRADAIKTYAHDIKLELDVECQQLVEELIHSRFPDHACLGEEDATLHAVSLLEPSSTELGYEWIIDPIDGTVNFSNGLPMWCCSVAVREKNGPVRAGAVYAPMLNALYAASGSGPALKNDQEIHVSSCPNLSSAIIMTGMDKNLEPGLPPLSYFQHISAATRKARIAGSAAVDLCWVAEGAADGYFEGSIYLWDIAAAGLINQRAGGTTEILARRAEPNQMTVLASNGLIHTELKTLISAVSA